MKNKWPQGWSFSTIFLPQGWRFRTFFVPGGGELALSKNSPGGGWSGLELTDILGIGVAITGWCKLKVRARVEFFIRFF